MPGGKAEGGGGGGGGGEGGVERGGDSKWQSTGMYNTGFWVLNIN